MCRNRSYLTLLVGSLPRLPVDTILIHTLGAKHPGVLHLNTQALFLGSVLLESLSINPAPSLLIFSFLPTFNSNIFFLLGPKAWASVDLCLLEDRQWQYALGHRRLHAPGITCHHHTLPLQPSDQLCCTHGFLWGGGESENGTVEGLMILLVLFPLHGSIDFHMLVRGKGRKQEPSQGFKGLKEERMALDDVTHTNVWLTCA